VKQQDLLALLNETLARMNDSERWLRRSHDICQTIGIKDSYEDDEYDAFETLTSRFARVSDMILQKVFRAIDHLELAEGGTLLDVLNRAEKRGLVGSTDEFRQIRELRNEIAHEYRLEELRQLFEAVLEHGEELFAIMDRIRAYCAKYTADAEATEAD